MSTFPTHWHHRARAAIAASLVVPFCFVGQAQPNTGNGEIQPPAPPVHLNAMDDPLSASTVPAGQEAITLSARFMQNSIFDAEGIDWTVKSTLGEVLIQTRTSTVNLTLKPGIYEVSATYGNVQIDEALTLQPESRLDVSFVLNAGALRVLPHLAKLDNLLATPASETRIYAINGKDNGKLIATSKMPGEILKLAAGTYRLSSHFANSNAEAITDIEVKPGVIRAVDIALHAGLVHLTMNDPIAADWKITPDEGEALTATATTFDMVLKPGHYTAEATVAGRHISTSFTIEDGEDHLVILPN
ncbi:MAG: hypothetical protein ABJA10_10405 [Aestuariivirga sp.]